MAHFSDAENIPFFSRMVSDHADRISAIKATSVSGLTDMTHVQASTPADIAAGVAISNGMVIR